MPKRRQSSSRHLIAVVLALAPNAARADTPMSYLNGFGAKAYPVVALTWGVLIISIAVTVIVGVLLVGALFRSRPTLEQMEPGRGSLERPAGGLPWIYIATAISTAVLLGSAVWNFVTLGHIAGPPGQPSVDIQIIGHQWWWEIKYLSDDPSRIFSTANEIHIPTGQPVALRLTGADVIHSFWVPALAGKTDTIPGQENVTWIEADAVGVYRGQCTEYCGQQHAHMALKVFAIPPDAFSAWWDSQLVAAAPPGTAEIARGQAEFVVRCGGCHAVNGTPAGGIVGPDLSHLMARSTIAAGSFPNNIGYLSGWIADPQHLKPGNLMPRLDLSGPQLARIRAFLRTLD